MLVVVSCVLIILFVFIVSYIILIGSATISSGGCPRRSADSLNAVDESDRSAFASSTNYRELGGSIAEVRLATGDSFLT